MRRAFAVAVALALTFGIAAPAALADDNSVYGAYVSRDADFVKLGKQVRRGLKTWKQSGYKRPKPLLRALGKLAKACDQLTAVIKAEQASSDHGAKAKAAAIASVHWLGRSAVTTAKGVRAATHKHRGRARKFARQADRYLDRSLKREKEARREFKAAGVQIKNG